MQTKRIKRAIDGVLLLDKPLGFSSNQALQKVKWLYQAAKAGHTGSLDPLATGLLPICLGEATKFSHFLLEADKTYRALIRLGSTTTTADAEGEVLTRSEVSVEASQLAGVLGRFVGDIVQVPPMYSALKHEGKALYEYARAGIDIPRKGREVTIHEIVLERFEGEMLELVVRCSKGTYIRTLAEDIGQALGCGAHLAGLRRLKTAHLGLEDAVTLEQLEALAPEARGALLLPVDATITDLPKVMVDDESAYYLKRGQYVWKAGFNQPGSFRIYAESGEFIGIGEQTAEGKIAPRRLIVEHT